MYFNFIKKNKSLIIGLMMLILLLLLFFLRDLLPFYDISESDHLWEKNTLLTPPYSPSLEFPMGTDNRGRDMLSLIILGTKDTLLIIACITILRYVIAIPIGYLAYNKVIGINFIISIFNGIFSYFPSIIFIILIATLPPLLELSIRPILLVLIIAVMELGKVAELIKEEFEQLSKKEYIIGAISLGMSPFRLVTHYFMPVIFPKLLTNLVFDFGKVLFLLAQMGFIGSFISQELVQEEPGLFKFVNTSTTWPSFFVNTTSDIRGPFWIPFFPALAITYTIYSFNLISKGIQNYNNNKIV